MPMRTKIRRTTTRRRTPAISARAVDRSRRNGNSHVKHNGHDRHSHAAPSAYSKAMRYLHSLTDFERLRIVRYNNINFNLHRMKLLLKKLGNPQEKFKS